MPALVLLIALASVAGGCERRPIVLGFWFEEVAFESSLLGGRLTAPDLRTIEDVARRELQAAFRDLEIRVTGAGDARYSVRVVQNILDRRMKRHTVVAGESRGVSWLGGAGAVNFSYFASGAMVHAPAHASRSDLIEAIGRGLGRGAVHEFAHQLIREVDIHASRDRGSYEYYAASRPEQYYGPMHWDIVGPVLKRKFSLPSPRLAAR